MNSILLTIGGQMRENVTGERFATLENEVKHITADVSEIKSNTKSMHDAIQSIDRSIASMSEIIKQNAKMEPRIEKLESSMSNLNVKIAAYAGAITAISFLVIHLEKVKGFFG